MDEVYYKMDNLAWDVREISTPALDSQSLAFSRNATRKRYGRKGQNKEQ
jgi:hypothetical protein